MKLPVNPRFAILAAALSSGVLLPKQKPKRRNWKQKLLGPEREEDLQLAVEKYLDLHHRLYFRLPDLLMFMMSPACHQVPVHWKKQLSDYLSDWPDLLLARDVSWLPYPLLLGLELKSKTGSLSDGQRDLGRLIRLRVAWNLDEATREIETFYTWKPFQAVLMALGEFATPEPHRRKPKA